MRRVQFSRHGKKTYPQEAELNWWFYRGRMGIRPREAKHLWENRHNNQMNLIPYDQDKRIMEVQTAKTKDQEPVIKMVTRRSNNRNGHG